MRHKILIADDDISMLNLLETILKNKGYDVTAVSDGEEAVLKAKSQLPSLIMLDIHMPKKNGIEALKEIKSDSLLKQIPVIMLTVEGAPSEIQMAMLYGAATYITKPAKKDDILKILENYLF
jgi:CheY-like chemotaxis protein